MSRALPAPGLPSLPGPTGTDGDSSPGALGLPRTYPKDRPAGTGGRCSMGTQWGPVREPGPIQCPAAWDIGLLSGLGRTTAAAAGCSELTGVPLPCSPCLCGPPILLRGVGVAAPCPKHPNRADGCWSLLAGGSGAVPASVWPVGMEMAQPGGVLGVHGARWWPRRQRSAGGWCWSSAFIAGDRMGAGLRPRCVRPCRSGRVMGTGTGTCVVEEGWGEG